jgi:tetratricopeptide (TPR) repeat protein
MIKQGAKIAKSDLQMDRIERLKEFLAATPEDNFLQHALALEYVKAGDDASARALFETILNRDDKYIGSYYHLAKLLERLNENEAAISVYEKGMQKAKEAGDQHAYNELRSAYEELAF